MMANKSQLAVIRFHSIAKLMTMFSHCPNESDIVSTIIQSIVPHLVFNLRQQNIKSVQAEWLHRSGHSLSEPSEIHWLGITALPASLQTLALHVALRSLFHHFFQFCKSSSSNYESGVVANCDYTAEWDHGVWDSIGIAMRLVRMGKSLLMFLLPAPKMHFVFTNNTHHSILPDLCGY